MWISTDGENLEDFLVTGFRRRARARNQPVPLGRYGPESVVAPNLRKCQCFAPGGRTSISNTQCRRVALAQVRVKVAPGPPDRGCRVIATLIVAFAPLVVEV